MQLYGSPTNQSINLMTHPVKNQPPTYMRTSTMSVPLKGPQKALKFGDQAQNHHFINPPTQPAKTLMYPSIYLHIIPLIHTLPPFSRAMTPVTFYIFEFSFILEIISQAEGPGTQWALQQHPDNIQIWAGLSMSQQPHDTQYM